MENELAMGWEEFSLRELVAALGVFVFNSRFAGQWFDAETGLYHNGFRDYHPGLGRYVQSDPIGLAAGWNTYAYVRGSPVNSVDPNGLIDWPWSVRDRAWRAANTRNFPGVRSGQSDAYRHCVASCEMTRENSSLISLALGEIHEIVGNLDGQPAQECLMDRFNNSIGRQFGKRSSSFQQCENLCDEAVVNHKTLNFTNSDKQYLPVPWGDEYK